MLESVENLGMDSWSGQGRAGDASATAASAPTRADGCWIAMIADGFWLIFRAFSEQVSTLSISAGPCGHLLVAQHDCIIVMTLLSFSGMK